MTPDLRYPALLARGRPATLHRPRAPEPTPSIDALCAVGIVRLAREAVTPLADLRRLAAGIRSGEARREALRGLDAVEREQRGVWGEL